MKRVLLCIVILFSALINFKANASHIVGGEVYYDYLGSNNYKFYFVIYRDCASNGAAYDSPLPISVFNGNNVRISNHTITFPGSTVLPIQFTNPCITPPSGICTERAIYTIVLNLPPLTSGYIVSYQRCCRGPNVTNLVNPDDTGLTLRATIPPSAQGHYINSSARFTNYPPLVICNNEDLNFNHSATDPDGDSLSYQLVAPFSGGTSLNPAPNPIPTPPYNPVIWAPSFSAATPLGSGSTTTINPTTGQLFVDANLTGLYVVGIRVNEWRNGVLINSTIRDFLFKVINCNITLSAVINEQENTPGFVSYCQGLTFTFDNLSWGATTYSWDFGVTGITTDVSSAFEPTYTFPAPGTYQIRLIANQGMPCTDTSYIDLTLENPFEVDFTFPDSTCFKDNTLDFQSVVLVGNPNPQYQWNFGPNATPQTATTQNVSNVAFQSANGNVVKLVATHSVCKDSVIKPIFFYDKPIPDFEFQTDHECEGFTQPFNNTSQNAQSFVWDFGETVATTDQSTATSPTYTYSNPGTYTITLISSSGPGCSDTIQHDITIYEPLSVSFTHNDSMCILNNSYHFEGTIGGPASTTFEWNFGPNAIPTSATTLNVNNVFYDSPGTFPVTLTAQFLQCTLTEESNIFVFSQPHADFTISNELKCEPYPAQFINISSYDAPLLYTWDFGEGGSSTETNPLHIYEHAGTYSVQLTAISTIGCIDTLVVLKQDLMLIHPKPTAGFSMNKIETTICESRVQFYDESQGAMKWIYYMNENNAFLSDSAPAFTFQTPGMHYPEQVVFNEFGCSDTTKMQLIVEPFTVFVPNTFTPDENQFNNTFNAVVGLEPVSWNMRIYNRWGQLIFETNDYQEAWDGTYKGKLCQEDIYSYVIQFTSCAPVANAEELTGHVLLIK